jgi:hypothetical protein
MARRARVDRTPEEKLEIVLQGMNGGNIAETCRQPHLHSAPAFSTHPGCQWEINEGDGMRHAATTWIISSTLAVLFMLPQQCMLAQGARSSVTSSVVGRYIQAIQEKDFKTVIALTSHYHQQIENIKAQNPRVLWPKLFAEFHQQTIPALAHPAGGPTQNFSETVSAMMGNPTQAIRSIQGLLSLGAELSTTHWPAPAQVAEG